VVLRYISEYTGYETHEVKILLKWLFLSHAGRNRRLYARDTHTLNHQEFAEFLGKCTRWAAIELGVSIPDPRVVAESYATA